MIGQIVSHYRIISKLGEGGMGVVYKAEDLELRRPASIYTRLGEKDRAFEWLEKAYEQRFGLLAWLKLDPSFDNLRSDPRFDVLLKKIGLEK